MRGAGVGAWVVGAAVVGFGVVTNGVIAECFNIFSRIT